jgi:polysaccharide export outer membrane protein
VNILTTLKHDTNLLKFALLALIVIVQAGCGSSAPRITEPAMAAPAGAPPSAYEYLIGAGDTLDIFVWRNAELTVAGVPVRPDGKISTPLIDGITASGKTTSQLAREIEGLLSKYIKDPYVTVIIREFVGDYAEQIRIIGEASEPKALSYKNNMTLLDVMIAVGGLTEFAAGNNATLIRREGSSQIAIPVRLHDLLREGDITANQPVYPGDVVIIPEAWF